MLRCTFGKFWLSDDSYYGWIILYDQLGDLIGLSTSLKKCIYCNVMVRKFRVNDSYGKFGSIIVDTSWSEST